MLGKKLLRLSLMLVAVALLAVVLYGLWLTARIEIRFAGRRWTVPSRVYSDLTLLYPGQHISQKQVLQRLRRLDYQSANGRLAEGQFHSRPGRVDVQLRAQNVPFLKRPATQVRMDFKGAVLQRLRKDGTKELPLLELEAEELLQIFGDARESRQLVSAAQIPKILKHALLAAEDANFYQHPGVDIKGMARALYVNLRAGKVRQGGSTLTQQLAKNYFLSPERTLTRKLNEVYIALLIDLLYGKDEILEIYLNEIYFGQRGSVAIHGLGEAASFYFGKRAEQLNLPEAATLAGLIRGPNIYSPFKYPKKSRARRAQVLQAMFKHQWIDAAQLAKAKQAPLSSHKFHLYIRKAPYFFDYLQKQLREKYSQSQLSQSGMSIYTTLDPLVQEAAEQAVQNGLARLEKRYPRLVKKNADKKLQAALIVMQPRTGQIMAMVGGRDYGKSQFNRVTQARRQPGSIFKPIVYASALEEFNLATRLDNTRKVYKIDGKSWSPKNHDGQDGGMVTMREALTHSMNIPSVDLAMRRGLPQIIDLARDLGLTTPLEPKPSLALGAFEVNPLEMARAYCALLGDGTLPEPMSLRAVIDDKGVLLQRRQQRIKSVLSPQRAYIVTDLMRSVVKEGTARSLSQYGVNYPVAGKTGTTNKGRDAWFVGATPELMALVWVGFDDDSAMGLSGASAALPIWANLMQAIPWTRSGQDFAPPPGLLRATVCRESEQLASVNCPEQLSEIFEKGTEPRETCAIHGQLSPLQTTVEKVKNAFGF